jgi:cell division septation protein DedD
VSRAPATAATAIMLVASWCLCTSRVTAQAASEPPRAQATQDSLFARARALVLEGKRAEGHKLADSLQGTVPSGTARYADVLFWQAAIADTRADSERIFRQIVVDYPLAAHAADALLQLAQIEVALGDHAAAVNHLQRFWRENAGSPMRASAGLTLARMLFDENEPRHACEVLADARSGAVDTDVELRNRLDFYWGRCPSIAAMARADSLARVDSIARADSITRAAADSAKAARTAAHADSVRKRAQAARAKDSTSHTAKPRYTVQVAAYKTRDEAQQLVDRLTAQGLEVHLDGTHTPFRVRVGRYATRAEATKAVTDLKKYGLDGFVASVND